MWGGRHVGRLAGLALACVGLSVSPCVGLQADPEARLDVDRTEVTVGDRLDATLVIEHAADQSVMWPDSLDLAPFEVLVFAPGPPRVEGDRAVSTAGIVLTVFELGELDIPPIGVELSRSSGETVTVASAPFAIGVVTVGLDEGQDIRDVKGPLMIAWDWWLLWPWLLLAAALSGLAYWYARRRRAREQVPEPAQVVPVGPPHEVAHAALDRLEASTMLERGEIKRFHIEVSQIVRTYIEARFNVDALEMTTGEVVSGLREATLDAAVVDGCRRFLDACDLVKFAKRRPDDVESRASISQARMFIDATIPVAPVEEPEMQAPEDEEAA